MSDQEREAWGLFKKLWVWHNVIKWLQVSAMAVTVFYLSALVLEVITWGGPISTMFIYACLAVYGVMLMSFQAMYMILVDVLNLRKDLQEEK